MKIEDISQISLLYDFYGQLLSKRQKEVMELYHEENLTLAEIAEEFNISRQGVHDALKNAEKALKEYEKKLALVAKFQKSRDAVDQIDDIIDDVIERLQAHENVDFAQQADGQTIADLKKVREIIDNLEE